MMAPTKLYPYDVALSYAGEDHNFADAIAISLQSRGVKVFYDKYEKATLWGKNLYDYLSDLYQNKAKYCVMFLSQHYAAKLWTNHERQAAQARAYKEHEEYILPVRLDDTEIPGLLPTISFLRWPPENAETVADTIIKKLGKIPKIYEDLRIQTSQLLAENHPRKALEQLENLNISQIQSFGRWRLIALRGQCYFSLRQFQPAQRDFLSAVAILTETVPQDQSFEAMELRLHLAAATRELGQLEAADGLYQNALAMTKENSFPEDLVAEAHWGMALVVFELANNTSDYSKNGISQDDNAKDQKEIALNHAQKARTLYSAIDEILRVALLDCQIALIEQSLGNLSSARERLQKVLHSWLPTLDPKVLASLQPPADKMRQYGLRERANVVSAAACYLASVEHAEQLDDQALVHIQQAFDAGELSYILRRAEAYMLKGQIFADRDIDDLEAEKAFRAAIQQLEPTDRIAVKIRAHDILGRHLLKQGRIKEGDQELDKARRLANLRTAF